jgi:hypothetical protein
LRAALQSRETELSDLRKRLIEIESMVKQLGTRVR